MKRAVYSIVVAFVAVVSLSAQESSHFAFQFGGGFTQGVGRTGMFTDPGWDVTAGAGINFNSYVGALVDLNATQLGINSTTLNNIGVPGGNISVFSATLDPIVHLVPHSRVDVYVTGGGGEYRRSQTFTAPTVATVFGFNPFFGFYPALVPANQILYSYSVNKPGVDVGMGVAFGTKWHGKFYAEAKYNKIFVGNGFHTDYLPVTFGFRW